MSHKIVQGKQDGSFIIFGFLNKCIFREGYYNRLFKCVLGINIKSLTTYLRVSGQIMRISSSIHSENFDIVFSSIFHYSSKSIFAFFINRGMGESIRNKSYTIVKGPVKILQNYSLVSMDAERGKAVLLYWLSCSYVSF